jgi:hypothetical protein
MRPQVRTTEVSTKIPFNESINRNFPWYIENSCIDSPQTEAPVTSSGDDDRLSSWAEIGDFHLNGEDPIPVILYPYTNDEVQIDKVDSLTNRLENFVAEKFLTIPEVEYVLLSLENNSIDIWTVINKLDREIRKKIYDVEYDILDIIKDFQFDFHVICRNDRSIEELYPSKAGMIFQR